MNTVNNAERPNPCQGPASNSALTNADNNADATVQPRSGRRHAPRQLPLVRSATAYGPAWGMVTVLIVLDQECECGYYHAHRVKAPAPALVRRTARCGTKYELALHAPRVRRGRRAA